MLLWMQVKSWEFYEENSDAEDDGVSLFRSWNHRISGLEGTLRSNFWQMHSLDKIAQQPAQLKTVQCWEIQHFPGEIMPVANCSHGKNFSTCVMC